MSPEQVNEILKICEATEGEGGFRDLPQRTTISLYLAKNGVGLTVRDIEAIAVRGLTLQARSNKGELYFVSLEDVFAANVDGRVKAKAERRAGFG